MRKKSSSPRVSKRKKEAEKKEVLKTEKHVLAQTMEYEKRIYDLEQLIDIAKSFCSTLDFKNLLESIVYICMAQMHVLGAEIFVRDLVTNQTYVLETSKEPNSEGKTERTEILVNSKLTAILLEIKKPVTYESLKNLIPNDDSLDVLEKLSPTLIVPLIQNQHLNGLLILQERIAIEDDTSYTDYEKSQIMSIASLASVAINNAALLERSSTDMMTHLKLKYYFFNVLSDAIDSAFLTNQQVAVLMFDIDFFKKFNDTYGHECGDFVLINVANIIKSSLRDKDMASRYGGEEFTVLLDRTDKEDAMLVAERIRKKIEEFDFVYKDKHLHVTISGGVSVYDADKNFVNSTNELVNQADQALYVSKSNGRNQVSFYEPGVTGKNG